MAKKYILLLFTGLITITFVLVSKTLSQEETFVPNPEVVRLVNEGNELHKIKDYLGALKSYESALEIEPNNVLVRQNLSIAHNNYGKYLAERTDYEKALKEFRLAIYQDPENKTADNNLDALLTQKGVKADDPQARVQIGDKLRGDAQFELALIEYQKALSLAKTPDSNILINVGDIYYILYLRDGQRIYMNKAIDNYKKALQLNETVKAHIKVGDALLGLKDIAGGIEHYKKAIALEPSSQDALSANVRGWNEAVRLAPLVPENHVGLASALQLKKDFKIAEEEYNQALKLDPGNVLAQQGLESLKQDKLKTQVKQNLELALKFQLEGKYDAAIEQYVKAIEINPTDPSLHYNIGTAFQAKEDFEHAQKAYRKSLELDPLYKKPTEALELLDKQINLKKAKDLLSRGIELQNSGNFQEAITTYLAAISITPQNAQLYYNLGTAYQRSGDLTSAISQYQRALDIEIDNQTYATAIKLTKTELANSLIPLAVNKQTINDLSGAISDYLKILEFIPDDAQTHFNLGTAYQANNQSDNALQEYLKATQLDPKGQADGFFFLGVIYEEKKNNKASIENYQKYLQNAPLGTYTKDAKDRMAYLKSLKQ